MSGYIVIFVYQTHPFVMVYIKWFTYSRLVDEPFENQMYLNEIRQDTSCIIVKN